jgi:hypothetical protein
MDFLLQAMAKMASKVTYRIILLDFMIACFITAMTSYP